MLSSNDINWKKYTILNKKKLNIPLLNIGLH